MATVRVADPAPRGDAPVGTPLLEVRDLEVHFPITQGLIVSRRVGAVRAVDGVSFSIAPGETLGLVGESGSGKTTTGRAIARLIVPTAGSIRFEGRDVAGLTAEEARALRRRIQLIFQNPYASLNPRMTVANIVADPLRVHGIGTEQGRRAHVRDLLGLVGIDPRLGDRYPHQFSGGQRQRIGIARALTVEPSLIVCDEPVSALDVSIQAQILNLLEEIQAGLRVSYLLISHDLAVVRHISHRVAVMYLGTVVELAPRDALYERPMHPYTRALLGAVHIPDPAIERARRSALLAGEQPSPAHPPSGCRFHTRCPLRAELGEPSVCVEEVPPLREAATGHTVACHFAPLTDTPK
jgi:oligopeptide transport system ATP-binding protein